MLDRNDISRSLVMRTLIDIESELMEDLLEETKARTKKEAIVTAIKTYLNLKRREKLASLIGNYDYGGSAEGLEKMRADD
jgi:Arc/MetJ family transcription regulator